MLKDDRDRILIGWASAEITPDVPCRMGGYAARSEPADAIYDPLYAHAIAFGTQSQPFVVIICDLLSVDGQLVEVVRSQLRTTYPGLTLWLGATHTHSGPAVHSIPGLPEEPVPQNLEHIIEGAAEAATEAIKRMRPMLATWVSGATSGIVTNRDHPHSGENTDLDLLCFYNVASRDALERGLIDGNLSSKPEAIVASFPCHPTVLSAENTKISADLPGAFRRHLRNQLGGECWIMHTTGAAGDMSTRHTRQGQGIPELERLGNLLAQRAYQLIPQARLLTLGPPLTKQGSIKLQAKEPPDLNHLSRQEQTLQAQLTSELQQGNVAQARTIQTTLQGLQLIRERALAADEVELNAEIAVASLGELKLAAIPGELYNSLGIKIKQAAQHPVLLYGYTNGYLGYFPSQEAYTEMDYEVLMSPFAQGTAESLTEAVYTMFAQ